MKKAQTSAGFAQIILILVVIALVGGGMYYFGKVSNKPNVVVETPTEEPIALETQKPIADPTANWKTYTNSLFGYSFRYPSIWLLTDLTQGQQVEIYYQTDRTKPVGEILVENITSSNFDSEINSGLVTNLKVIGNIEAKCKTDNLSKTWCFIKNGDKYLSLLITKVQNQDDYNKTLDQILSTFKFTSGNIVGKYCAGPQNLNCPSGYACKLNVIGKIESGGTCVNEAETNP